MEIVRRIYEEGLLDRDPDRLLALVRPDVEYVNPPEAIDPGVRRGIAEVALAFRGTPPSFSSSSADGRNWRSPALPMIDNLQDDFDTVAADPTTARVRQSRQAARTTGPWQGMPDRCGGQKPGFRKRIHWPPLGTTSAFGVVVSKGADG